MSCQRSGGCHIQQVQDQLARKSVENPAFQLGSYGATICVRKCVNQDEKL